MSVATTPAGAPDRSTRSDLRTIGLLWAIFTILGVVFALVVPHHLMGRPASNTMTEVERTFTVFSVASAPVAAAVWALAVYSLLRWRRRGAWKEGDPDGPALRGHGLTTGAWMFVSSALCLFLLIWGLDALSKVDSAAAASGDPLEIDVTGQQWVWTFTYPSDGVESDQLVLPLDRPVVFKVTSDDVIHSFWVPEMGIKVDANPGMTTTTSTTPDRLGTYHVRCAELCGLLHADMETGAQVVSTNDFDSWVAGQGGHA
ncbi:MAG TPA: cytochrome c oxidase subunit II [Nocardioides sp.]|uniref:cytochrome c oxidase subunit II n=1 Tax=Nocardioides sp. TaxID=35761 RepID=UPI002E32EF02|nr:cytochrome c oxidase subunit II [Nocardioides sp.]HEX3931061.1 cytochrome c oxidase subunit II [Nocardioides sp.]